MLKVIKPMKYLSVKQTSEKWGISVRRVNILCSEKRIPGATKIGFYWAIPADAEKPRDARIKSGKYIKLKITQSRQNSPAPNRIYEEQRIVRNMYATGE